MWNMQRSEQALINRGRKAGLNTREIYSALSSRPPEADERGLGVTDSNGFVVQLDSHGQRIYRPAGGERG